MKDKIYNWLKNRPQTKRKFHSLMIHPNRSRPRWWLRLFAPFYISRGSGAVIYSSVRKDIAPFNKFSIGDHSVVEDFSVLNNLVGAIHIGKDSRVGISNVVIGPVSIGNNVNIAQGVVLSGIDHNYKDPDKRIDMQGITAEEIVIDDDVWIGANSVITKGVKIGRHSVVAACSMVNRDVPEFCVAGGNPAVLLKRYDPEKCEWVRVKKDL